MGIKYLNKDSILSAHNSVINASGGLEGVKNEGQLESVLFHIQNDDYYPTFEKKMVHLVYSIAKFHLFNDGNKRTSIASGAYFLNINGFEYCSDIFIEEMENIILWVVIDLIDKDLLEEIIVSIIINLSLTEEIKIKLLSIEK